MDLSHFVPKERVPYFLFTLNFFVCIMMIANDHRMDSIQIGQKTHMIHLVEVFFKDVIAYPFNQRKIRQF